MLGLCFCAGLSLVAASGGHSSSRCAGLSLSRPLLLLSTGSRRAASVVVAHGPSCSAACGIFPDQGSNLCPLHWQADSQPRRHQEASYARFWTLCKRSCTACAFKKCLLLSIILRFVVFYWVTPLQLFILLWMSIWVISSWLLWIALLWTSVSVSFGEHIYAFLLHGTAGTVSLDLILQRQMPSDFTPMWNIKKNKWTNQTKSNKNKHTDSGNRVVDTRGKRGVGGEGKG